eukprot:9023013-Pyramimonas_sp.AAC.1
MISAPDLPEHEVVTGRLQFARIHWGCLSGYYGWHGPRRLCALVGNGPSSGLNRKGHDWLVGGDWNNEPAALFSMKWATAASAIPFVPDTPTCRQATPGIFLDYFVVPTNHASIIASHVQVDEGSTLTPHCPVQLRMMAQDVQIWSQVLDLPKELPLAAPPGCSRYRCPYDWGTQMSADVTGTQGLADCM